MVWELFGAAYQGIFIVKEREEAIPDFWKFVSLAGTYYKNQQNESVWKSVFSVLQDLNGNSSDPEVQKILNEKDEESSVTGKMYAYSDLKPRGHYVSSVEMKNYFRAFRYFTTIFQGKTATLQELNNLPEEIKLWGKKWIDCYGGFIAPSRSPMVWGDSKLPVPAYCTYPQALPVLFPLSWGFDNEVLYATVYHPDVPEKMRVEKRMLPSGLDLAAVLGNGLADKLLSTEYQRFPNLKNVIDEQQRNYRDHGKETADNLYGRWMDALAVQWADSAVSGASSFANSVWSTKRLQTGLASWATLRHATILVNERTVAECGEGGFEEILMRAPRGYVEPDPATFDAIASLFDAAVRYVSETMTAKADINDMEQAASKSLYEGMVSRLKETAAEVRSFKTMAEKEIRGEALSNEENEAILFVARTAEHNFLIFNSLSNKDYALSTPDPMGKIADIAGGGPSRVPYLMAAVGNAMEWDQVIPFFGRREIVKGSVYSYYEFVTRKLMNDEEWRKNIENQEFLPCIKPYITPKEAVGVAKTLY